MGFAALALIDLMSRSRGLFRGNAAQAQLRPIRARLASTRPRRLATAGDSGRGIANTTPWYSLYLAVDLASDLEETVTSAARAAGFQLGVDQRLVNGMLGLPGPGGENVSFRGEFNPASSYLIGESDGRALRVKIIRDGKVRVFASGRGITWGQWCTPSAGKGIVSLHMSLDSAAT